MGAPDIFERIRRTAPPIVNYVRAGVAMEETTTDVFAACSHPIEVRFFEGATETERRNGLAEVVSEPCSSCMADFDAEVQ